MAIVEVDFRSVLPWNAKPPSVAIAEVVEINDEGREHVVESNMVLNLSRGTPRRVPVWTGEFLVRLSTPSGQLLTRRVRIDRAGEEALIELSPVRRKVEESLRTSSSKLVIKEDAPSELAPVARAPSAASAGRDAPRPEWTAKRVPEAGPRASLAFLPGLEVEKVVQEQQNFLGIARLQASSDRDSPLLQLVSKDLSSALVGDIEAFQASRIRNRGGEMQARWKKPLRNDSIAGKEATEGKGSRFFALSYQDAGSFTPLQVACVPGRWRTAEGELAELLVTYRNIGHQSAARIGIQLEIDDPELAGLIEFLQQGDLHGSTLTLSQALDVLYEKRRNPYAAAAAGYVLIQASSKIVQGPRWPQWILNLATRYPGLPDGAILFATMLLQTSAMPGRDYELSGNWMSPFASARGAVLEAVRRGPPLFRFGLGLMAANLAILEGEDTASADDEELQSAIRYVRSLSLRVDPSQPFSVFDVEA